MPEPTITLTLTAAELRVIQRVARYTDYLNAAGPGHSIGGFYNWLTDLPTDVQGHYYTDAARKAMGERP